MQAVSFRVYSVSTRARVGNRESRKIVKNRRFFQLEFQFHNQRLDAWIVVSIPTSIHTCVATDCERKARRSIATCPITWSYVYISVSGFFRG